MEEGDRTAEKKFRKKPKQRDKGGHRLRDERGQSVVCAGDPCSRVSHEGKRNGAAGPGKGDEREEDATAHVYIRQQKGINPLLGRRKHKSWRRDSFGGRTASGPGEK